MKYIKIILLFLLVANNSFATNFYFSNSGLNSNAGTQLSPWQTLDKLNSVFLAPGDSVKLNGGQSFSASGFNVNQSGTDLNKIVFCSYGTGKPIITGMTSLTGWVNEGGNIWSANLSGGNFINMVTMYGNQVAPGRTPNTGWQTISSYSGANQLAYGVYTPITITGNLPSTPNYTGGYIAIKNEDWLTTNGRITSHSGSNITAYHGPYGPPRYQSGYGYFIQHHPSTLDQQNEWYYDSIAQKLKVYSTSSPSAFNVRAATANNVLALTQNYIKFENIIFEGAKQSIVQFVNDRAGIYFKGCEFYYAGINGINSDYASALIVEKCVFKYVNNNGIVAIQGGSKTIIDNNLSQIGMVVGSAIGNNQSAEGMFIDGDGVYIARNKVDSVGYNGISYNGTNVLIENNIVTNFTLKYTDGGAFYTGDYHPEDTNVIVRNNIALYGEGNRTGTPYAENDATAAYYGDEYRHGVQFYNNIGAFIKGRGFYLHKTPYFKIKNNLIYNAYEQITVAQDFTSYGNDSQNVRHTIATGNILFAKNSRDLLYMFYTPMPDVTNLYFDTLNYNYLFKPLGLANSIKSHNFNPPYEDRSQNVDQFKAYYSASKYEANTMPTPARFNFASSRFEYNSTLQNRVLKFDTGHIDTYGNRYIDSITIAPFSAVVLVADTLNDAPIVNAGADASVQLPIMTTTLSGTGSDPDGSVSYSWSQVSGPAATIVSPNSKITDVSGLSTIGPRTFRLTVTDNYGAKRFDDISINVLAANVAPTANAGADIVVNATSANLSGSGADSDGSISIYAWSKISGSGGVIASPNSAATSVTGLNVGTYVFRLTVTDNSGFTAFDNVSVRRNAAPVVTLAASAAITLPVSTFVLPASASDPDGSIISNAWVKVSGPGFTISNASAVSPTLSNLQAGVYVFRITSNDNDGAATIKSITLTVNPAEIIIVTPPGAANVKVRGRFKIKETP